MNGKKLLRKEDGEMEAVLFKCSHGTFALIDKEFTTEKIIEMEIEVKLSGIVIGTPVWILGPSPNGFIASGQITKIRSKYMSRIIEISVEESRWPRRLFVKDLQKIESDGVNEQFQWINKTTTQHLFARDSINNIKGVKSRMLKTYGRMHKERNSHKCTGIHPHCSICGECHTNMLNHDRGHR